MAERVARMDPRELNYLTMLMAREGVVPSYLVAGPGEANPRGWGSMLPVEQPIQKREPQMFRGEISNVRRPQDPLTPAYEGAAEAIPYVAPVPLGLLTRAPRVTGALVGGAAYFGSRGDAGSGESREQVKDLQQRLNAAGYYSGPIDGIMGRETREANERFQADEGRRRQMEIERAKAEAEAKEAEAALAESERKRKDAERRAKEREEGAARLKEIDKDKSGFWAAYGTPITYGVGAGLGILSRLGATYFPNRAARIAADKANRLVSGTGDLPARAHGVNRFWQEGGARQIPFPSAPKGRYGLKSNPRAEPSTSLYPADGKSKYIRGGDAAAMGAFGAEVGVSMWQETKAREELRLAREAVSADPSEANIRRMKAAEDELAFWEGLANAGRSAILGYGAAGKFATYRGKRPDVDAAGAERTRIDNLINQTARPIRKRRKP